MGRDVSYEAICEIMYEWNLAIWQKPHIMIRDFLYVEDSDLLFYVLEGYNSVFVKNFVDGQLVGILPNHDCTPCIEFIAERYVLVSGDSSKIRIWRIYEDLIGKFDELPPWESNYIL